jgi:hypothetical protein
MSRGHGEVQRFVLAYLAKGDRPNPARDEAPGATSIQQLTRAWDHGSKTSSRAAIVSVRRAVDRLEEEGLVEVHRFLVGRSRTFVSLKRK